ncbi:MAG TPA: GNAT family N-acetyltransferase [Ruminiclostridium sp.]
MVITKLAQKDIYEALKLVLNVFMMFEAPDYIDEGINTFKSCISNQEFIGSLAIFGAFKNNQVVGVIATRNEGNHIALFFVDGKYHRQGIGKKLFEAVIENSTSHKITVNSSPYAIEAYHHLGFIDTNSEQLSNGMRYTPMIYTK